MIFQAMMIFRRMMLCSSTKRTLKGKPLTSLFLLLTPADKTDSVVLSLIYSIQLCLADVSAADPSMWVAWVYLSVLNVLLLVLCLEIGRASCRERVSFVV